MSINNLIFIIMCNEKEQSKKDRDLSESNANRLGRAGFAETAENARNENGAKTSYEDQINNPSNERTVRVIV